MADAAYLASDTLPRLLRLSKWSKDVEVSRLVLMKSSNNYPECDDFTEHRGLTAWWACNIVTGHEKHGLTFLFSTSISESSP
jgi:hypothetical protein